MLHRIACTSASLLLLACTAGCATFLVEGSGEKTPEAQVIKETVHNSFWGFQWRDSNVIQCDADKELFRVKVHQNVLFALSSIATLGLYAPQSVETWCVPRDSSDEDAGPSLRLRKKDED